MSAIILCSPTTEFIYKYGFILFYHNLNYRANLRVCLAFHVDSEGQSAPPTRAPPYQVRTHSVRVPNTQEYSLLRAKKKERESGGM